jgi:hypothetical protein
MADYATLTYNNWKSWSGGAGGGPPSTVGKNAVLHLLNGNNTLMFMRFVVTAP